MWQCFLVEKTPVAQISLRRYCSPSTCPSNPLGYHDAEVIIGEREAIYDSKGYLTSITQPPKDDSRWPTECCCGYKFEDKDYWQINQHTLYSRVDGQPGKWITRDLPIGAMFYPDWLQPKEFTCKSYLCPTNDSVLMVITPYNADGTGRHEWIIDTYCSNCDRKGQPHHCWCRHGEAPNITVDKIPPDELGTCGAGAGSIWANMPNGWHGFLRDGKLLTA